MRLNDRLSQVLYPDALSAGQQRPGWWPFHSGLDLHKKVPACASSDLLKSLGLLESQDWVITTLTLSGPIKFSKSRANHQQERQSVSYMTQPAATVASQASVQLCTVQVYVVCLSE